VKVLLTSRRPLNELVHNEEKVFNLHPLSKESTIKLLFKKLEIEIEREILEQEIKDLIDCPIPEGSKMGQILNMYNNNIHGIKNKRYGNLLNHPFVSLLGGHPQAISLVVPMLKDTTLKDLFLNFCDSNMMDVIHEHSELQSQNTSLRVSLELSISRLRDKSREALELFCLIGLLPSGVNKDEISQIWGDKNWSRLKNILIGSSLLIHKYNDGDIYYMLPFMSERAWEILEEDPKQRTQFHLKCCALYKNYCYEFYKSEKSIEDIEGLASIESNIWACIYRAYERNSQYKDLGLTDDLIQTPGQASTTGNFEPNLTFGSPSLSESTLCDDKSVQDLTNLKELVLDMEVYRSVSLFEENKLVDTRRVLATNIHLITENFQSLDEGEEEFLVVYYATSLIFLHKHDDALKAVNEYLKNVHISLIARANLLRIQGFLLLISAEPENVINSIKSFKSSLRIFQNQRVIRGVAICQLGISKICHDRYNELVVKKTSEERTEFLSQWCTMISNAIELFKELKFVEGEHQWVNIQNSFSKLQTNKEFKIGENVDYKSMLQEDNSVMLSVILDKEE